MDSSSTFMKSDSSSDDIDHHHQQVYDESNIITTTKTTTTTKRSYECTYCKRGFTNAQALGGHMNIHRKDRVKAKESNNNNHQNKSSSSFSKSPLNEDYFGNTSDNNNRNYYAETYPMYVPSMVASHDHVYHPQQQMVYCGDDYSTPRSNEDGGCANLSLQIGSPFSGNWVNDNQNKDLGLDLDLELRLGPDP